MTEIVLEVPGRGTVSIESLPDPCQLVWQGPYVFNRMPNNPILS